MSARSLDIPEENLTEGFPPASSEAWRVLVDKALKGDSFDKRMTTRLYDGITLKPIYTQADWSSENNPSEFPDLMAPCCGEAPPPWSIRQVYSNPDVKTANSEILTDLEHGVTSLLLRLDAAGRGGMNSDGAGAGLGGMMISTAADLDTALAGVMLELVPVALDAGGGAVAAARLLGEVWRSRGVSGALAQGAFNVDPLATLATNGTLPTAIDSALEDMATLAKETAQNLPNVTTVGVDTSVYFNGGSTDVTELGCAMATGVAYLRAMTDAGMTLDDACAQIAFTVQAGPEQFLTIAKLRAARLLWAHIARSCGASPATMCLNVTVADRVFSQRDPWVNLLRITVATFAAGVAHVASIIAPPFDRMLGQPSDFARRLARNTQTILQEEANLGRVLDPAGGSWYVETLTRKVAERAWQEFQDIEKEGGLRRALESGRLQEKIAKEWAERRKGIAKRKVPLTGVSEFPNLNEAPMEKQEPDLNTLRKGAALRLKAAHDAKARTLAGLTQAMPVTMTPITPVKSHRVAEDWEALRDASDAYRALTGTRPTVFLANMGRIAQHTARATFARNFFAAGGIEATSNNGFTDAHSAANAFTESTAPIAVLCGGDDQYVDLAVPFARALKSAGASRLYMAGRPTAKDALDAAGVDDYIFIGCDALEILRAAQTHLGVGEQ